MRFFHILLTLLVSFLGVWTQGLLPNLDQWVLVFFAVFLVAWFGDITLGMISTLVSLTLAGLILIPRKSFDLWDLSTLLFLTGLGFWVSFSMDQYKKSRLKLSAKESLEESWGFLDTLIENIPMMVFVKDARDLRFIKFNKAGLELLGYNREDLLGKNDLDFFPAEEARHFIEKDRQVLGSAGVLDIPWEEISTAYGKKILHTRKIPVLDITGKPLYLLGVSEDITEKIQAENLRVSNLAVEAARLERARIQERESFVSNAISSLSTTLDYQETLNRLVQIMIPTIGDWCTLTLKNDDGKFERTASLHAKPALQIYLDEFNRDYPPNAKDLELQKTLEEGSAALAKTLDPATLLDRSQSQRKFELYLALGTQSSIIVPIKTREKILGALSVARGPEREPFDELDLILAEEIGRRAGIVLENSILFKSTQKAVKARDEFLSIASHELKTPITSLKMQIQMLQRNQDPQKIQSSLGNAVKQVDRLTLLVNDLLDVGRFESGKMSYNFSNFSLNQLVQEVAGNLKGAFELSGSELVIHLGEDHEITGDKYRLEQVLVNLLNNALKYGSQLPVELSTVHETGVMKVKVKDSGRGIPQEFQEKIFDKFERGRQDSSISGLGLGLFISREIVLAHGGQIAVKSRLEQGAEFSFTLPLPGAGSRG
jgi:two-component system, sensor histidine kinase